MTRSGKDIFVPAGFARAFEVPAGREFDVIDVAGGQIADFIAFNLEDPEECFSAPCTRLGNHSIRIGKGSSLYSNRRQPLLEVTEDTVGTHDLLIPACDEYRYSVDYGVTGHRNCVDNFTEALETWGIPKSDVPDPLNIFENSGIGEGGELLHFPVISKAGDFIRLRALMDLVCAVSACPMDLNVTGGDSITDILVRFWTFP
ncbi:MAG: DUF1989 domain-containing protein [Thermovirgaceae bacterium]